MPDLKDGVVRLKRPANEGRETAASVLLLAQTPEMLDPVLDRLLGTALHVVRADAGSIMLLSRERDTLVVVAGGRRRTPLPYGPPRRPAAPTPRPATGTRDGAGRAVWWEVGRLGNRRLPIVVER